jgi:cytochrome c556
VPIPAPPAGRGHDFGRKLVNGTKRTSLAVVILLAMLLATIPVAMSQMDGDAAIKARKETMEQVGKSIGALAAIAKKEAPFDAAVVKKNAENIANLLQESASMFPEGSDKGAAETWAKAEIWSDPDGFKKALKQGHAAAVEMAAVTDEAAFGPALGKLGNGCKSCHDKYRRPKE